MARTLSDNAASINPERVDPDTAHYRRTARKQDVDKDREDPQVGPVENRARAATRRVL